MAMSLGIGIGLPFGGAPTAAGPVSDITSIEVVASSPGLDATGDYSDATVRIGVTGGGWVAKAIMPYLALATFDPSKITFTVSDPGYDGTGSTTVTRTITGTAILRRQYNAATSRQAANDGIDFTVYFALSDDIFDGSTITAVSAASGYYGAAAAGSVASVTNSSDAAYPKPLFAWLNVQHARATGSYAVEAVAGHRYMRNGRQVARIEFIAKDTTGNTAATQTASSTSLSSFQTQGQIVEAYKATIPVTALNQAELCFVNAKVYPWIGDSSAVLDLLVDGVNTTGAVTTANCQTPLRFLNDKDGTYGGAHVAVKAGAAGTVAFGTYAAAVAAPMGTINAALTALQTYNNANKGHNDHSGGTIWLMEDSPGGGANHSTANSGVAGNMAGIAAGLCMTEVKVDPAATGAVKMTMATTRTTADLLHWFVNIDHTAGNGLDGSTVPNDKRNAFDNLTVDLNGTTATVAICYRIGLHYMRNVTFANIGATSGRTPGNASLTSRTKPALHLGVIFSGSTANKTIAPFASIGCQYQRVCFNDVDLATITTWESNDGAVFVNNILSDCRELNAIGESQAVSRGKLFLQNVFERATGTTGCFNIGGDGTSMALANIVEAYNTYPGISTDSIGRVNAYYADVAAAQGVIKTGNRVYNLYSLSNSKRDTFTTLTTVTGRVGSWRFNYNVGNFGNVVCGGSSGGSAPDLDGASWLGEYWPANTYNVGYANVTWTNNQSGAGGAGGGTYTLTGVTNSAYDQVPSGLAGLGYDLAGVARLNDGTGAAGAYERT